MPPLWTPYCGTAPSPGDWLGRWNVDPNVLLVGAGLAWTWFRLRAEPGARPGAAAAALAGFVLLFVSPFCALTSALFSARVAHHVLLTAALAPLLVAALPARPLRGGMAGTWPMRGSLAAWTAVQAVVFWAWHAPPLYAVALGHDAVYWLMQASLVGVALGFWSAVRRASPVAAAAALLATMVQMGLLGALLTFSAGALYAPHLASTFAWGLTPLEDQQLGGLVMWAPASGFYLVAALVVLGRWLARQARPAPLSA
ncbi:MAG TPA: cytochrome c oxidase assembly protein [Caldimonas sp.]|jgi:putative membrane protein|nr:cytochrome c oxidase assembly protein [Caldimonas sp.]HEX2542932.1 cytochrome c oxidase assembly protein [Caldimonas sp.]